MEDGGVRKEPCRYADRSPPDRAPHLPRCRRGGKASPHRANGHTLARRPDVYKRQPLLNSDDDYKKVAAAIKENMASFDDGKTALCLMGHGTEADSNADYRCV